MSFSSNRDLVAEENEIIECKNKVMAELGELNHHISNAEEKDQSLDVIQRDYFKQFQVQKI